MKQRYAKLRGALKSHGIEQIDVAKALERSVCYVSHRYTGREPWKQDEMYQLMEIIGEPYERIYEFFPPGGIEKNVIKKAERTPIVYQLIPVEAER